MTDEDKNADIRLWVSIGEAATQVISKISYDSPKQERDADFLIRMEDLAGRDTDSGHTMVDTDDLRRLVEIAERFRSLDRAAAEHVETVIIAYSRHFTGFDEYVGWRGLGVALRKDYELLDAFEQSKKAMLGGKKK